MQTTILASGFLRTTGLCFLVVFMTVATTATTATAALRAVLSIGTNTVRLLIVADEEAGALSLLEHHALGTRLGEGLGQDGDLQLAAMERTLEACLQFATIARERGALLECIATSVLRRARNADNFAHRFEASVRAPLVVIDGEREAAWGFAGAVAQDRPPGRTAMLDIGGGSTECAIGTAGIVETAISCEIGTVRLTEAFPALSGSAPGAPAWRAARAARDVIREALTPLRGQGLVNEMRAVAGTPCTLAALVVGAAQQSIRGRMLDRPTTERLLAQLLDCDLAARRALPGILPQRADILAAGALLLLGALDALGIERARVETNDLLLGYLLSSRPLG